MRGFPEGSAEIGHDDEEDDVRRRATALLSAVTSKHSLDGSDDRLSASGNFLTSDWIFVETGKSLWRELPGLRDGIDEDENGDG